jgi:hypothetical protein
VQPLCLSGAWRDIASMPSLPPRPPPSREGAGRPTSTTSQAPKVLQSPSSVLQSFQAPPQARDGRRSRPAGGEGLDDVMQEIIAIVGMDDVHICRIIQRLDPRGHPGPVRLSRLFSLAAGTVRVLLAFECLVKCGLQC